MFRSSILFVASFICLTTAAATILWPTKSPVQSGPIESEIDLGEIPVGEHSLSIPCSIEVDANARIVGFTGTCGLNSCYSPAADFAVVTPSEGHFDIPIILKVTDASDFMVSMRFFATVHDSLQEILIHLRGKGIASK